MRRETLQKELPCGLARGTARLGAPGLGGEKSGLFEHPAEGAPVLPHLPRLVTNGNVGQAPSRMLKKSASVHGSWRVKCENRLVSPVYLVCLVELD